MLITAILAFALSTIWTCIAVFANKMSDSPSAPFSGAWTIWACWLVTAAAFGGWALEHWAVI